MCNACDNHLFAGRSPRVRRNLQTFLLHQVINGSISTRVEESRWHRVPERRSGVDLRACGGPDSLVQSTNVSPGRSPRMRRNHPIQGSNRRILGSISAGAEETLPLTDL